MRSLPASADSEIAKQSQRIVFLAEITAVEPGQSNSVTRVATEQLSIRDWDGSTFYDWDDKIAEGGISIGWIETNPVGGLGKRGNVTLTLRDEGRSVSSVLDTHYLGNDTVKLYSMYHDEGASILTNYDFIEHGVYTIQSIKKTDETFTLTLQSDLLKRAPEVPTRIVLPDEYPNAPEESYGQPLPIAGQISGEIADAKRYFVRAVPVDKFAHKYVAAINGKASGTGTAYQYYEAIDKLAVIESGSITKTYSNHVVEYEITDLDRRLDLLPVRELTADTVGALEDVRVSGGGTVMGSGGIVEVQIEGVPKLGDLTSATLRINFDSGATNNYDVAISYFGTVKNTDTGQTTATYSYANVQSLTGIDWTDDWDHNGISVKVTSNNATTDIEWIRLEVYYEDGLHAEEKTFDVASTDIVIDNTADDLNPDGATNPTIGASLYTASEIIEYILRHKHFLNLTYDDIDGGTFNTVATFQGSNGWAVFFPSPRDPLRVDSLLDELSYISASHLIVDESGAWSLVNRRRAFDSGGNKPDHIYFYGNSDFLLKSVDLGSGRASGGNWTTDLEFTRLKTSDVLTEFIVRYVPHPADDNRYMLATAETSRTTLESTCSTTTGTKKLNDATASFASTLVGQKVFVDGAADVNVIAAVDSGTQLELTDDPGTNAAGTAYYLGPNLNKQCLDARLRYGVDNPLGRSTSRVAREGGYKSKYLAWGAFDETDDLMEYLTYWFTEAWIRVEFSVHWNVGVKLEIGDRIMIVHPALPSSVYGPSTASGSLASGITDIATSMDVGTGEGVNFAANGFVRFENSTEIARVTSVSTDTINLERGIANTDGAAHSANDEAFFLPLETCIFEVQGYRPLWSRRQFRVRALQIPGDRLGT